MEAQARWLEVVGPLAAAHALASRVAFTHTHTHTCRSDGALLRLVLLWLRWCEK